MSGCKVCRVLESHDLSHYNERLLDQWVAPKPERKGYRQLAEWLNISLLRREMDQVGLSTLGGEAESKYERLQGDDPTAAEVRANLKSEAVNIDELERDFVSYGVIRTHLQECLGAEREEESSDWEEQAIEIATEHASTKIDEATRSLKGKGKLSAGSLSVDLEVEVECDDCHTRLPLQRALRRGYVCKCEENHDKQ